MRRRHSRRHVSLLSVGCLCVPDVSRAFGRSCLRGSRGCVLGCGCRSHFVIHANCDCVCGDTKETLVGGSNVKGSCAVHLGFRSTNGLLCTITGLKKVGGGTSKRCALLGVPFTRCLGNSFSFTGGLIVSGHGSLTFRFNTNVTVPCNGTAVLPFRGHCFSNNTGDIHK